MVEANGLRNQEKQPPAEQKSTSDILADAVHSALYSAVQEPVTGVTQIVDAAAGTNYASKVQFMDAPQQAQFGSADWHAQQIGSAVGMLAPFLLVHKGVKGALGTTEKIGMTAGLSTAASDASLLTKRSSFGMNVAEAGLTGFTYDALLKPSDSNHTNNLGQFLTDRGTQGAIGAGTFMTMTAAGLGLNKFAGSAMLEKSALVPILKNPIANGVLSGIPAGLFTAEASSLSKNGNFASATEVGQSVYGMAMIGGGFGAVHALTAPGEAGAPSKIDQFKAKFKAPDAQPREGLALASGDDTVGPVDGSKKGTETGDGTKKDVPETTGDGTKDGTKTDGGGERPESKPFDGNAETEQGLEQIQSRWKGRGDQAEPVTETPVDKPADKTGTPIDKPVGTLDMLGSNPGDASSIINPALRDATADSAAAIENTTSAGGDTGAPKRKIQIPEVATDRVEDLRTGVVQLHNLLKAQDAVKSTADAALVAEAKAKEPLATDDVIQLATEARERATKAKEDAEQRRIAFSDYVNEKGEGLRTHLEDVAKQLKHPDVAREIVDHDFTVKEGKTLLSAATADGATAESREAFEQFVREKGGNKIKLELEKLAAEEKNADVAKALLDQAFGPRRLSFSVEDPGQQAAMNVGIGVLAKAGGPDSAALAKFAGDYGPAMEKHMRSAAEQLGYGVDVKLQIAEAYHGPALKQGVDLLRATPPDPISIKEFSEGAGKTLHDSMAQAALDLGLSAKDQLMLREAYKGNESWVSVEETGELVPVNPAREADFRTGVSLMQMSHLNDVPGYYVEAMRAWMKSPDNADLVQPMRDYAQLSGDPHMQAFIREVDFPKDNMTVTGKPGRIAVDGLLGGTDVHSIERRGRFNDFLSLTDEMRDAPASELSDKRQQVFNWLNRNNDSEVYDAVRSFGEQSADSRVVAAIDSYFGTNNMKEFFDAKAKYEKVADEITPELIKRMQRPGAELFWDLAPPEAVPPRKWGGEPNIENSKQARTITKDDEGNVTAEFSPGRHPQGVVQVKDSVDGTRVTKYADGSEWHQLPQGYDMDVKPDGSWRARFSNGNYIIENASGPIQRIVYENNAETTLYRDGEVRRTSVDDQTASKWLDGTKPGIEDVRPEEQTDTTDTTGTAGKPAKDGVLSRDQVAAFTEKLSSSDYNEASTAAILLKNGIGKMTDTQFVQWLNFAMGSHPDAFSRTPRQVPNWPDLHMRADGQVLLEDSVQEMLRGGKTEAEQNSPEGQQRAYEGRTLVRNFLDAPEDRPSTLQYPAWLVTANKLPPDQLPRSVLRDLRVRFTEDQLPPDVSEYLKANPEKPSKGRDGKERGPFQLSKDDLPGRMRALSDTLHYAPKDIQEKLLSLGMEDGRALRDIISLVSPPKSATDWGNPVEYKELLELTAPQAEDIYSLRLMFQAIKEASGQKEADRKGPLETFALKAASRFLPEDNPKAASRIIEIVSGISNGKMRAPRRNEDDVFEAPKGPGAGKHKGQITREDGLRSGETYPTDEQLAQMDGEEPTAFDETILTGTRNETPLDNWQQTRDDPEGSPLDMLDTGLDEHHGIVNDGIDVGHDHGDGL